MSKQIKGENGSPKANEAGKELVVSTEISTADTSANCPGDGCIEEKTSAVNTIEQDGSLNSKGVELSFTALTPETNIENGKAYFDALDWALAQADVRNIAITGPYGSGKSSVIESYLSAKNVGDCVRISLAKFNFDESKDGNTPKSKAGKESDDLKCEVTEKELEEGILKQLFYSVKSQRIPLSRYRKIQVEEEHRFPWESVLIMMFIIGVLYFIAPDKVETYIERIAALPSRYMRLACLAHIVLCGGMGIFFQRFALWLKRNGNIKEINLFNKASIKQVDTETSVFNKNMDEIVYFFEATQVKIVIFEDLDRFNNTNIFIKLREINYILNNYSETKGVKFIYAIRDELFEKARERTKFFDFILPIVPYITSTNSGEMLRKKLSFDENNKKSMVYDISSRFVSMVAPFIRDMRVLTCVCNEFKVYKQSLNGLDLQDEKMLALIIFKNLYPKNFAELENDEVDNIVRLAFDAKEKAVEQKKALNDEETKVQRSTLETLKKEAMLNIRELKVVLLGELTKFKQNIRSFDVGSDRFLVEEYLSDSFDINRIRNKPTYVITNPYGNKEMLPDIEDVAKNNGDIFRRIEAKTSEFEKSKSKMESELAEKDRTLESMKTWTMKQLIANCGTSFLGTEVQSNDFLVLLLRHGYLDETYKNYINYFYPQSMTETDMNFILHIKSFHFDDKTNYTYRLYKLDTIFEELTDTDFTQKEVLNFDLVDYTLESKLDTQAAKLLIEQLSNHTPESMGFIFSYVNRENKLERTSKLIQIMCENNSYFWNDIMQAKPTEEDSYKYLALILQFADLKDIAKLDSTSESGDKELLSAYIESQQEVLMKMEKVPLDRQKKVYKELNIRFSATNFEGVDPELVSYIFDNNLFTINGYMLRKFFEIKAPNYVKDQERKNYTTILKLKHLSLLEYIRENFTDYVSNVVLGVESNNAEETGAINDILERLSSTNDELCLAVLNKEETIWENIEDCCSWCESDNSFKKRTWDYLLDSNKVKCTWNNVVMYYDNYGKQVEWEAFIDRNVEQLLGEFDEDKVSSDILYAILLAELSEDSFRKFVKATKSTPYDGDLMLLNGMKIGVLIENKLIPFSSNNWNKMSEISTDIKIEYAITYPEEFMAEFGKLQLTIDEINMLLESDVFSNESKKVILGRVKISSMEKETAERIKTLSFSMSKSYSDAAWNLLDDRGKVILLVNQMDNYSNAELSDMFSQMGKEYRKLAKKGWLIRLPNDNDNLRLLKKLKARNYVVLPWLDKKKNEYVTRLK